ncbi:hypothetical protein QR685DRAFT_513872 [Neurospora intermedia]|uniref:Uncharacterized protein n=1 Tax=Neurospora intermedia TaxID=5142 RepID=A0ABR3DT38_NEUIN
MFSSQQGPFMFMPPSKPKAVASSSAVKPGVKQPPVAPSKPPAPVKEPSMFSSQQGPVMFRPPSKPKAVASSSSVKPGVKQPPGPPSKPKAVLKAVSSVDVDGAFQMVFPPRTTPTRWSDEESDGADEAVPQQATKVHKGLSASRHAPPATAPPPKQMSFPILEQRKQLTSKHSQQKADQESVLQQTSLQNQFRQYKKPDFTLDRGERRKLWELVTSAPTRFPFELTLQSADWCYKHCLGDNLRIIREFKANSNVTGLEVYFEDGFTKLIVGPRKQIHHSFRQSTAQRMWDLWLMLSKWINEDPELTMSKGLDSQLKKAAEKRAIEACSLMNSTTPPSPTETQRQQFTQTVGAQDKAKASLQKRLNDIWAHLSRDSSQPVDATEAQTAMTQFLQKELSSNSVLTEVQITEEVELENQRWMWMHAEHKRQYDAAAKREQAKGKGKAGT